MANPNKIEEFEEREIKNELDTLRHSTAHIMAHAVKKLYPEAKFGIGPTIEDGFYYDIDLPVTLTPEDLPKIEAQMQTIIAQNNAFEREELTSQDASQLFTNLNQPYKLEIIRDLKENHYSVYREGDFVDLCRGPHIQKTGQVKAFKLLSISGAFWRGDQKNKQLQRIYGTAFKTTKELKEYLELVEEAKKRDHRKIGRELDLFSFDPVSPGGPFFHPKGAILYNRLVKYIRDLDRPYNYQEIITPQILDVSLWHRSGHYENYKDNMYFSEIENREYAIKPMNCPASTFVYASHKRSYRDLPLRFADFGRLHRFEKSGALSGLTRVRSFCIDDAHVYCTPEQIESEVTQLIQMIFHTYEIFEFKDVEIFLSTRPPKRVGSDELWDLAEKTLAHALDSKNKRYHINPGDGAFYGPKIDFVIHDALKRPWQLGTIQLDFNMPERFDLEYVGADNHSHRPVMIHRAIIGSFERFIGVLIEHYAGAFPLWLAPIQCILIPIGEEHKAYCHEFLKILKSKNVRASIDERNESMGLKTREAQTMKIPLMLVAGGRELESGTFSVRKYSEKISKILNKEEILAFIMELQKKGQP